MIRLGTDTGGTFTDFVWVDGDGRFHIYKQLSTPQDPSLAVLSGIDLLGIPHDAEVVHGSTVSTNALLEGKGARTALITTSGFADVLAIGRQNRPDLYALVPQKRAPLVPARWRFEAQERINAKGEVLIPLNEDGLKPILQQLVLDDLESVAVCLLFSFLHPEHEQDIQSLIQKHLGLGAVHISLSCEILPEYREYERTATTVINAYVAPIMSRYLKRLAGGLGKRRLRIMQSNGGTINSDVAGRQAARTVLSGPAGGVVGARFVGGLAGYDDLITFDMGGTSTDVALCPGRLPTTSRGEIADLPLRLPIIDIHTVGAGGGSLAYVDAGGALHVGPQSAGADPGPACYGQVDDDWHFIIQGQDIPYRATTTDANLVLGRLDAGHFLGGEMALAPFAAEQALSRLAESMGTSSMMEAASGVLQVANATMERAIGRISVERGYDPRRFTLVAFGGAGPLHACDLAHNMSIPRVLIPTVPGVLSALGMLAAVPTKDYSQTVMRRIGENEGALNEWLEGQFSPLAVRAVQEMVEEGHDPNVVELAFSVDMRYAGQSHELTLPYEQEGLAGAFHALHESHYGYQRLDAAVEIVNVRLTAVAPVALPHLQSEAPGSPDAKVALLGRKQVWFEGQMMATNLYERSLLCAGHRFSGPAVIFQYDTTTVVPPSWEALVDGYGNLVLTTSP